ncbi:DNA-binding protein [Adhaeribacter aquaticus]|uniref:DNA-binding protein n=1 Tax=Adhaeribacter aquaticus TaxID=299567 RepID=UPI00040188C4|nr:DNA-binding protein [Adhaeribacter aquaticus]
MNVELKPESYWDNKMLEKASEKYGDKKALMDTFSKVYKVGPELYQRLQLSKNTVYSLIHTGKLKAFCVGEKGYRVTELACLELLGDTKILGFTTRDEEPQMRRA